MVPRKPPQPPDWRPRRLDRPLALAVAHLTGWAGLGECVLVPPSEGQDGWVVLVFLPEGGEPLVLPTLGAAVPLLRRGFHTRKLDEATRLRMGAGVRLRHAEAQVRRELARTLAKDEAQEEARR